MLEIGRSSGPGSDHAALMLRSINATTIPPICVAPCCGMAKKERPAIGGNPSYSRLIAETFALFFRLYKDHPILRSAMSPNCRKAAIACISRYNPRLRSLWSALPSVLEAGSRPALASRPRLPLLNCSAPIAPPSAGVQPLLCSALLCDCCLERAPCDRCPGLVASPRPMRCARRGDALAIAPVTTEDQRRTHTHHASDETQLRRLSAPQERTRRRMGV